MKRSVHAMTKPAAQPRTRSGEAFGNAGAQPCRREAEQRREHDVEREEIEAGREWLRHVGAGRIG